MSILREQLQDLQLEKIAILQSGMRKNVPSIIFGNDSKEVPIETVHEISLAALHELQTHSEIFFEFEHTIFSENSITFDRDVADPSVVKTVDGQLVQYIMTLVGYFNYECAIKSLEYLIRRYRIDLHQNNELFLFMLPYHDLECFGLLVNAIEPRILQNESVNFPLPRSSIYQFFAQNNFEVLGMAIKCMNQLKTQQSKLIYYKFIYTMLMEMISGGCGSQEELSRRALDQVLLDVKSKKQQDILYYILSCSLLCFNHYGASVQGVYVDKLLFNILELETNISTCDVVSYLSKLAQYLDNYEFSPKISKMILMHQLTKQSIDPLKVDIVMSRCLESLLQISYIYEYPEQLQEHLELTEAVVGSIIETRTTLVTTFKKLVRLLLTLFNNNIRLSLQKAQVELVQNILNNLEEFNETSFTEGIELYIKNGGDMEQIRQLVQNELTIMLNDTISIDNQEFSYFQAFGSKDANIRYEAYINISNLISVGELPVDLRVGLLNYLFNQMESESDLEVTKMIINVIRGLLRDGMEGLDVELVCNAVRQTWKRALLQYNNQIYEISDALRCIIKELELNELENVGLEMQIELDLEKINGSDKPEEQTGILDTILRDIGKVNLQDDPKISSHELVTYLGANTNLLDHRSLVTYYVIHNVDVFIKDLNYRVVSEIFGDAILKLYFIRQFCTRLSEQQQCEYHNLINMDEGVLEMYLDAISANQDVNSYIKLFVQEFYGAHNAMSDIPKASVQINQERQIIVYHGILVRRLQELSFVSEEHLTNLLSVVHLYNKNNLYDELAAINEIVCDKYSGAQDHAVGKEDDMEALEETLQRNNQAIVLEFFDSKQQNEESEYIISLQELLQTIQYKYLNDDQLRSVADEVTSYITIELDNEVLVQVVGDLINLITRDTVINFFGTEKSVVEKAKPDPMPAYFKYNMINRLDLIMQERQHIDFECEIAVLDHLNQLNDIVLFGNGEEIADELLGQINMDIYCCFKLLDTINSPLEELMVIPYITWIISDVNMFTESKENAYLASLEEEPYFKELVQSVKHYIEHTYVDIDKNELIFDTNPLVFVTNLLSSRLITNRKALIGKLVQLIMAKDNEIITLNSTQLILKVVENIELDADYNNNENSVYTDENREAYGAALLDHGDAEQLVDYLLDYYRANMTMQLLDILIEFVQYVGTEHLREHFIPRLFNNFQLTSRHVNEMVNMVLTKYDQISCLQLIARIIELTTTCELKYQSDRGRLAFIHQILMNITNYIPEFLPSYVLYLLQHDSDGDSIQAVDLINMFDIGQELGSISVILGYLFDIGDVTNYLYQSNENYIPIQVMDMFMTSSEEVINCALQFSILALRELFGHNQEQDVVGSQVANCISKSMTKEDSPLIFLYKVALQLPENTENITNQLVEVLSIEELIDVYASSSEAIQASNTMFDNYKLSMGDSLTDAPVDHANLVIDSLHEFILTKFERLASQYLINVLLGMLNTGEKQGFIIKVQESLMSHTTECTDEQTINIMVDNMIIVSRLLESQYIPYLQWVFQLLSPNSSLRLDNKVRLMTNIIQDQSKYLSSYIHDVLCFCTPNYNAVEELHPGAFGILAQNIPLRVLLQKFQQHINDEAIRGSPPLIKGLLCEAITNETSISVPIFKQVIELAYNLDIADDLNEYYATVNHIFGSILHTLRNAQVGQNEMELIIGYTENLQTREKDHPGALHLLLYKHMCGIKYFEDNMFGHPNKQHEINQLFAERPITYDRVQGLNNKAFQLEKRAAYTKAEAIGALELSMFTEYQTSLFENSLVANEEVFDQVIDVYVTTIAEMQVEDDNVIKDYVGKRLFTCIGNTMSGNPFTQEHIVRLATQLSEDKRMLGELICLLEGVVESGNQIEQLAEGVKGGLSEALENKNYEEEALECSKLVEKIAGKDWRDL